MNFALPGLKNLSQRTWTGARSEGKHTIGDLGAIHELDQAQMQCVAGGIGLGLAAILTSVISSIVSGATASTGVQGESTDSRHEEF